MNEKDIERIMGAEHPVPSSCSKAADKALAQIKAGRDRTSVTNIKSKSKHFRRLPVAAVAAVLVIAVVCAGGIFTQLHDDDAATNQETAQGAIDYRTLCQNELDKLESIAKQKDANGVSNDASNNAAQSSDAADSIDAEGEQLSELIADYEKQLDELSDDSDLQDLYKQICASVEDYE